MRALVVTSATPPVPGRDVEGFYRRLTLFMGAIGALADRVDVVHLVPQSVAAANPDGTKLNEVQTSYWGFPVSARMIVRRDREQTFANYYLKGILSAAEQPSYFGPAGKQQAAALASILDEKHDFVFVHRFEAMCALLRTRDRRDRNVAFDLDDVEHRVRLRASLQPPIQPGKLLTLAHIPAIIAAERAGAARSRLTFVCSEGDRAKLRRFGIARGVTVVPNAVHIPTMPPSLPREANLLYIGDYGYPPNAEAAERFATRILPRVRRTVPDAKLLLVGKRAERLSPAARGAPGVECLGFVESLDDIYARARIVGCPLLNGGGTRVKLIEGAAYGKPIVSTRVGAEGLDFVDGTEIMLSDDDDSFATACSRLLGDDALCQRLGTAARDRVRREYDADQVRNRIADLLKGIVGC